MDHKETTHLVTQTHFLSIPTFLVSFKDAYVKNHFIWMRSQIWIHGAVILIAKFRRDVTFLLLLRKLSLCYGNLVALNHGIILHLGNKYNCLK